MTYELMLVHRRESLKYDELFLTVAITFKDRVGDTMDDI